MLKLLTDLVANKSAGIDRIPNKLTQGRSEYYCRAPLFSL